MRQVWTILFGVVLAILMLSPVGAQSTTTTFVLSPASSNIAKVGDLFAVTIQLKSSTAVDVNYARAILLFDPTKLEIVTAEAGTLFCSYPSDSANYTADNTKGQLMITGLASGTTTCAYPSITATPANFAKVTFKTKKSGTATLSFLYSGTLADDQSGITKAGSPAVFVMTEPSNGAYSVAGSPSPPPNLGVDARVFAGIALVITLLGWVLMRRQQAGPRVVTVIE